MKKILVIIAILFSFIGVQAQESTTDYIYSADGFAVKTGYITFDGREYRSTGLYSKDGKVLVSAMYAESQIGNSWYDSGPFFVIDGCETIASCAFQSQSARVYIPSTVKTIAPDALISHRNYHYARPIATEYSYTCYNHFAGIVNGCKAQGNSYVAPNHSDDPEATEVGRYSIDGLRLAEPTPGINIVQYSNGTADKVLIK